LKNGKALCSFREVGDDTLSPRLTQLTDRRHGIRPSREGKQLRGGLDRNVRFRQSPKEWVSDSIGDGATGLEASANGICHGGREVDVNDWMQWTVRGRYPLQSLGFLG
jgi:hypothetical protein